MERNSIEGSMFLLSRMGIAVGSVIDAGAAEGGFFLMLQKMGAFSGARYLFIDCLEENLPIYRNLERAFGHRHEICALAAEDGDVEISVTADMYGTGIKRPGAASRHAARTVKARRLDDVMKDHGMPGPYLLKLDLQGGEVGALRGATETLKSCAAVLAEARPSIRDSRDDLRGLLDIMQDHGFVTWDIVEQKYKGAGMTMYQCDVLFIRQDVAAGVPTGAVKSDEATVTGRLRHRDKQIAEINALIARAKLGE